MLADCKPILASYGQGNISLHLELKLFHCALLLGDQNKAAGLTIFCSTATNVTSCTLYYTVVLTEASDHLNAWSQKWEI